MVEALQFGSILQIGSSLQYRIESILGRGGFGLTYLATDINLDTRVAIKEYLPGEFAERTSNSQVIPKTGTDGETYQWGLDRFIDEARILARFKHPSIVRVLNVFKKNNTAYMIMEYEEGSDLTEMFKVPGFCSEKRLVSIFDSILSGLEQVHKHNIIHRDIKPANIYIRSDNTPVLLDFGSARKHISDKTQAMTRILTRGYAPYEQEVEGGGRQGPWTDIYSIGVTLYYAISKQLPTNSVSRFSCVVQKQSDPLPPVASLDCSSEYSEGFLYAIEQALQIMPNDRPQTAEAFRLMLNSQSIEAQDNTVEEEEEEETETETETETNDVSQDKTVLADEPYTNESAALLHVTDQGQRNNFQPPPTETTKQSSNKWLIGGLSAIILSLIGGNIFLFISNRPTTESSQISVPVPTEQPTLRSISRPEPLMNAGNSQPATEHSETVLDRENKQLQELIRMEDENKKQLALAQHEYQVFEDAQAAKALEAAKLADEEAKAAEIARLAAEKAKAEEVARLAAEAKAEEAARLAAEAKAEEAARLAAEAKAADAARLAAEARNAEVARLAAEAKAEEAARLAAEAKAEEAARLAAEAEAEEAVKLAAEAKAAEAAKLAEKAKAKEAAKVAEKAMLAKAAQEKRVAEAQRLALLNKRPKTVKNKAPTSSVSATEQKQQDTENDMQTISRLFNEFRVHLRDCRVDELAKNSKGHKNNVAFVKDLCNVYTSMKLGIKDLRGNSVLGVGSASIKIDSLLNQNGDHIYPSKSWNTLALKTDKVDGYWQKVQW